MKKIILILSISLSNLVLSQDITLIYVDNSKSINRGLILSEKLQNVIKTSNNIGDIVLADMEINIDKGKTEIINKSLEYSLQDNNYDLLEICGTYTKEVSSEEIINFVKNYFYKNYVFNKTSLIQEKNIEIHLFFNIKTFVFKDYRKLIRQMITEMEIKPGKTKITVHLDYDKEKSHFTEYLNKKDDIFEKFNIKINKY